MSTTPPSFVANFDSASAMTMALARYFRQEDFPAMGNPRAMEPIAVATAALPRGLRERIFIASGALETVPPSKLDRIDLDDIGRWTLEAYPEATYPAVAVGSSSGAGSMLQAALGAPFLPQTALVPVRQRVHPDDPVGAMEVGIEPGRRLLEANPEWQLHHMHDANQDRLMVRALTYFRVKRRSLGDPYRRFIEERLADDGTLLLMECTSRWRTTRVGERHVFQHGALGGATEREFHEGGPRVREYLERYDSPVREWDEPEPDGESPEAEWGFEESLREDALEFASRRGLRVVRVVFDDPHALSPFVAELYRWWYRSMGLDANRLLIQSFIAHEPYWTLRTRSVPFWMRFNMEPSLEHVRDFIDASEPFEEIYLMLFQHGVDAVGLPEGHRWREEVLDKATRIGATLGADLDRFPADLPHYGRYNRHLRKQIKARYPLPPPLSVEELLRFAADHDGPVEIEEVQTSGVG
jgi:hypothetical protein